MDFELKIRGNAAELERVIRLINGIEAGVKVESGTDLDTTTYEFVQGLSTDGMKVIRLLVDPSRENSGVPEWEIKQSLEKTPYGVMGGMARRWSSVAGTEFGTPFRKQGSGNHGVYRLSQELAGSLSKALGS